MTDIDAYGMDGTFMQSMRRLYLEDIDEKLGQIRIVFEQLQRTAEAPAAQKQARLLAHRMAGTAASYGFQFASEVGRRMELLLDEKLDRGEPLSSGRLSYLLKLVGALEQYFEGAENGEIPPELTFPER